MGDSVPVSTYSIEFSRLLIHRTSDQEEETARVAMIARCASKTNSDLSEARIPWNAGQE
ncbi:hypothetical protein KJ652_00730 [Patescibacteria group bacterium]|nr:hypothetical protein [Patescibacteria group bacterium]